MELAEPGELAAPALSPKKPLLKLEKLDKQLGLTPCLILTVSENGYGKRTDVDRYRLQSRGGKGVINMKTGTKTGKVTSIQLVDDTTEMMVISQFRARSSASIPKPCEPPAAPTMRRQAARPRRRRQGGRRHGRSPPKTLNPTPPTVPLLQ